MKSLAILYYLVHVLIQSSIDHNPKINTFRYEVIYAIHDLDSEIALTGFKSKSISEDGIHDTLKLYENKIKNCSRGELCIIGHQFKEYLDILIAADNNITRK